MIIKYSNTFKKDYKKIVKRGYDISILKNVIELLVKNETLSEKHKDHNLIGEYKSFRECHLTPDWLLIYKKTDSELILTRTGSHSDLF